MRAYASIILLITFATGICYFVLLGGSLFPVILARLSGTQDIHLIQDGMALPTRLAVDYAYIIALFTVLITVVSIILLDRYPTRQFQFTLLGLCSQCLLIWVTLFAYLYDEFLGPVSMHHRQRFDFGQFFSFGFGAFPVMLAGLVAAF